MASIDKLFATKEQYRELRGWLLKNKPHLLEYIYEPQTDGASCSLFPQEADAWLYRNCPFEWVTKQIESQYNVDLEVLLEEFK